VLLLMAATPAPADLTVPAELTAKTCNPELSGLTWVPALSRYLAISDDTGLLDTPTWHAPWVFTFDERGRFDAAPRVLEGLEALDDAESITPGPPGTFFLTTSHTISKKGKSKPIRRQLLWLELKEQRLLLRGRFDLTTLISPRDEGLDIEALAFRDGALFVGLKAPLDEHGRAAIMRIENIVSAFDKEKPATLTAVAWARPKLEVADAEGRPVPEGVTDLLFLSDGRLVLAANSPKSGKPDGGGAIWVLTKPDAKPVLLHRFPGGLKPEGLSLSPDGKRLVVVFDRGPELSQWVQLPLP
jgi:hypothetical protein